MCISCACRQDSVVSLIRSMFLWACVWLVKTLRTRFAWLRTPMPRRPLRPCRRIGAMGLLTSISLVFLLLVVVVTLVLILLSPFEENSTLGEGPCSPVMAVFMILTVGRVWVRVIVLLSVRLGECCRLWWLFRLGRIMKVWAGCRRALNALVN